MTTYGTNYYCTVNDATFNSKALEFVITKMYPLCFYFLELDVLAHTTAWAQQKSMLLGFTSLSTKLTMRLELKG